tara:strand:- start:131 stop:3061 length:2931 start_codon:yes stop_codon:yes gene_type:complete
MKQFYIYLFTSFLFAQGQYNHPELDWETIETDHFRIHFYSETENSARLGAYIADSIYTSVTNLYNYKPFNKTDIVFTDVDDISNGAAYFYDNKIIIWTSPLDFELRGSHKWLENVITHEFTHIVSIQSAQKFGKSIPGAYLQYIGYEKEKRPDVLYGYPNSLISYPIPGTSVPPWLAEGVAQFMYPGADWDNWDSIRDMILRDRVINTNMLTWNELNTFGKSGIGNESVYNTGYAFSKYLAITYTPEALLKIMQYLGSPGNFSINKAIKSVTGKSGENVYKDFSAVLNKRYKTLAVSLKENKKKYKIIIDKGSANLHPTWSEDGSKIAFLSNKDNDYFGSTDLYIYNLKNETYKKIVKGVYSKPTWNGENIYYSKRSKLPNKVGSSYYDIYEYDFSLKKEWRLTKDARAFSPLFIGNNQLFYISTQDGSQNIYLIDIKNKVTSKITNFSDQEAIGGLSYDKFNNRLIYDITTHHFKNINYINLSDSTSGKLIGEELWDERQSAHYKNNIIYSDDRTGVFNLYFLNNKKQGYITNVSGGAFMPDINEKGKVVFSVYENSKYKIAILDSVDLIKDNQIGYTSTYYKRNKNLSLPLEKSIDTKSTKYTDLFPPMFVMPRIMVDYGTIKPGFYFYSSEILEKVSLTGGASSNKIKDLDLFFIFEYRHLYPTLFLEAFYITRNIKENYNYSVYKLDNNLKFRLLEFRGGLKIPFYGTRFEIYSSWSRYRASIKEQIIGKPEINTGIGYDYFRGKNLGLKWDLESYKRRVDQNINPVGFSVNLDIRKEFNEFIEGLDLSESGTLISNFNKNNLLRIELNGKYLWEIPNTERWTISLGAKSGLITNTKVDSFFYFFGGGLPGLKGYPFYSIEGSHMAIADLSLRIPFFREKHISLGWLTLQHGTFGIITQMGDAWNNDQSQISIKKSVGLETRLAGYSFYNYPTAIGFEMHRGIDSFIMDIGDGIPLSYGGETRYYLSILFGF